MGTEFRPEKFILFGNYRSGTPREESEADLLIGAALGAVATGLKMVFGIERSYLGGK